MKRFFIGIDGTSQAAFYDKFYSNVYRTNLALAFDNKKDRTPQFFIYYCGVGTASRKWRNQFGKSFAQGIEEIILQAYVTLVSNYEPGDKIYVFGFSRGAVAARALTGLISRSGLLRYECSPRIEAAWYYFLEDDRAGNYRDEKPHLTHKEVKIEFLGVWDTVYGISTKKALEKSAFTELRFHNFRLDPSVKAGVHILSVDDTRKFFEPMLWDCASNPEQKMEQIWMPGVHCDIGGGYSKAFISTVSLLTMLDKLAQYCPDVDYDTNYISKYLVPLLDEDIVINDEWAHYCNLFDFQQVQRRCENTRTELRQSVHPLLSTLRGRTISYRGKITSYEPSYVLSDPNRNPPELPPTEFPPTSYNSTAIAAASTTKPH